MGHKGSKESKLTKIKKVKDNVNKMILLPAISGSGLYTGCCCFLQSTITVLGHIFFAFVCKLSIECINLIEKYH